MVSREQETREEVRVSVPCECGGVREQNYVHVLRGVRRTVHMSSACSSCNSVQEADFAELPVDVRDAILREHGTWTVVLPSDDMPKLIGALRRALNLSFSELSRVKRGEGDPTTGTQVETAQSVELLLREGITATVRKLTG